MFVDQSMSIAPLNSYTLIIGVNHSRIVVRQVSVHLLQLLLAEEGLKMVFFILRVLNLMIYTEPVWKSQEYIKCSDFRF